jgi:hypothetical protein
MVLVALVLIIILRVLEIPIEEVFISLVFWAFLLPVNGMLIAFLHPLYHALSNSAFKGRKTTLSTSAISNPSKVGSNAEKFLVILNNPSSLAVFEKFLTREFAVENLLFWRAIKNFESQFNDIQISREVVSELAKKIYKEFCTETSLLSINLSFPVQEDLKNTFNQQKIEINANTFLGAEKEIFRLMLQDSYRRFSMSPEFKQASQYLADFE